MQKNFKVFSFGILGLLLAIVGLVVYLGYSFVNSPSSNIKQEIIYEIAPATSFLTIAKELQAKGVVKNAQIFSLFAK